MPDRVGQQLGNYQLLRLLGEGGSAEVYLSEHIHLGTQAAIKVLHTQLGRSDIEMFRHEARAIAHLEHPHIVRVLEFGVEGTTPYLVMDYAQGGTLRTRHPKGTPLSLETLISYVQQVASALQYAHDHKLIHRDVKPENLLVGRSGNILLSDFGIALILQSTRYQSTRDMAGTIAYMAPEQIETHPRPESDQYSLGIVVYEWLSGDRPFHGSFTEIAIKQSLVPPPPLLERVPTLSPMVEQVVMRALAKDPKQRFDTVQAFADALEQASQSHLPTEQARLAPFSSELPPKTPPIPPPITAPPLAKPPYQPADPSGPVSVPTTQASPDKPRPRKVNEQGPASHRKRDAWRRLALLALVGLVIVALASGLIWFTFSHGASPGSVVHHTTSAGNITEFPVPTSANEPHGITAGPDSNLWFTEYGGDKIGRISTNGAITEFPVPTSGSEPSGITAGPDGNLWFTESGGNKIGRISTNGAITEFSVPTSGSGLGGITAGPDGNLWFTEVNKIGRISTSGTITEFPVPTSGSGPGGITAGPDGNLWFTEVNKIGRISTSGAITEFPVPTSGSGPDRITVGPDGNLWFAEFSGNKIGRISTSGAITEFPVPTSGSEPGGITAGPDGNLWFTEKGGNKIGRISTSGAITEFSVPTSGSRPDRITAGSDDNLWFTETAGDKIGRITSGK